MEKVEYLLLCCGDLSTAAMLKIQKLHVYGTQEISFQERAVEWSEQDSSWWTESS